jgi:hypothetical protein
LSRAAPLGCCRTCQPEWAGARLLPSAATGAMGWGVRGCEGSITQGSVMGDASGPLRKCVCVVVVVCVGGVLGTARPLTKSWPGPRLLFWT